jgi:DHA1 family putative efflux transporter-like MFS transporter
LSTEVCWSALIAWTIRQTQTPIGWYLAAMSEDNTWKIYTLSLICFVINTSEFVVVGILDQIAPSTHITLAEAGQLLTVFAVSGAIGTPVLMAWTARWERRTLIILALVVVSLGSLAMLVASSFPWMLASRLLLALGTGVFNASAMTVAARLSTPDQRARTVAIVVIGFSAALIIGLPVGRIITEAFGWQAIFYGTAALAVFSVLLVARSIPRFGPGLILTLRTQLQILKSRSMLGTLLFTMVWWTGYSVLYSYIAPFITTEVPWGEQILSLAFLAFGAATIVGSRIGGWVSDRFGPARARVQISVFHALALASFSLVSQLPALLIPAMLIWAAVSWASGPLQQSAIYSISPESSGISMSLNSSFMQLGFAAGSGLGGFVVTHGSLGVLVWTGVATLVVAGILALLLAKGSFAQSSRPVA